MADMGMVRMKFTSEDAQAVRSFMKLSNKQKALQRQQKKLGKASKRSSKKASGGMKKWLNRTMSLAAGYMGVHAAIGKVKKAHQDMVRARESGARQLQKEFKGVGQLAQVATGKQDMKFLQYQTYKTQAETGMKVKDAAELVFKLRSSGKSDQRKRFAGLEGLADPVSMISDVAKVQGSLGRDETGSSKELLDKFFVASKIANANVSQIATGTVKSAKMAGAIGTSDEELLAATAVGSKGEASVKEVSTGFRAFSKQVDKSDLGDQGMMQAMKDIQKRVQGGEDIYDILKSQRAVKGYKTLRDNMTMITGLTNEITEVGKAAAKTKGTYGAVTSQKIALKDMAVGDAQRKKRAKEGRRMMQKTAFGEEETQRQTVMEAYEAFQTYRVKTGKDSQWSLGQMDLGMGGVSMDKNLGYSDKAMIQRIEGKYGMNAAMYVAEAVGRIYAPGTPYHLKDVQDMPQSGKRTSGQIWNQYSMAGSRQIVQGIEEEATGKVQPVNVQSDVPGTTVEHDVKMKDARSPQQSRTGGAAGVE